MKRLIMIVSIIGIMFADNPVGNWKLSGLRVDYYDIAREPAAVVLYDTYGFGVSIPVAEIPTGALFNHTARGPFSDAALQFAGVNLNVNLYPDGSGVIGQGSYYPDVDIGTNPDGSPDCETTGQIYPITDAFSWETTGGQEGNFFPAINIIGQPTYNALSGQTAYGLGVSGSSVFDNWNSTPTPIHIPSVLPAIADATTTYAVSCGSAITVATCAAYGIDAVADPDGCATFLATNGLIDQYGVPQGDYAAQIGACLAADPATALAYFGGAGWLPGAWGGYYREGNLGNSQMGQELDVKFLLEWSAIDGWESESGLGDDLTVDEDGDGTDYDRIFGIPYVTSTYVDYSNPLCDITGGALTGTGPGLVYPVAGDIVDALGGTAYVGALITGLCLESTAATLDGYCLAAGGPTEFIYGSCLGQVQDGVEAQCDAADLDGDGFGTPVEAVTGLCYDASQSSDFAAACAYYGAANALIATCLQLGFDEETCAAAGEQGIGGVEAYCVYMTGVDCATAGIDQCSVLTDPTFAYGLCGTLAGALTTSETCEEWADSFSDEFLNDTAVQVIGATCSDYAASVTGSPLGAIAGACAYATGGAEPYYTACVEEQTALACGSFAEAGADEGFAQVSGMTCTEYGASYVGMCLTNADGELNLSGATEMYLMDPSLTTWGMFLTYNAVSVSQYQAAGYSLEEIIANFPQLFVNDSGFDFDPTCYATGETCGGRLVMEFYPTCVAEVEAHTIVAEFVDLLALECDATGNVAGGFQDINGNGCWDCLQDDGSPYSQTCDGFVGDCLEAAGGDFDDDGNPVTNVVDVVRVVNHIIDEEASLGGYLLCAADMNTDGVVNVVDVVAIVNIVLGNGRAYIEDATEATIVYSNNEINIEADGYIGGIDITVEFADESFDFELGDHLVADWAISGNTARIVMVSDSNIDNVLTLTSGQITDVVNVMVANSHEEVPTTFNNNLPEAYEVKAAYPNPFNPSTTLELTLNISSDISVKVYNLTGQLVDVIAEGNFAVGNYSWNWNAENLASGVYFISTQVGNDINQQKVMLIK